MIDMFRLPRLLGSVTSRGGVLGSLLILSLTGCGGSESETTVEPTPSASGLPRDHSQDPPGSAISGGVDWRHDQRLRGLLGSCAQKGHFNRDTSDMLPVLVEKLQASQQSVLRHVREELALLGEPALKELARVVRRGYSDRHKSHGIVNALGVFRMSDDGGGPTALDLYRECLGHPQETIRMAAIKALTDHAGTGLYDEIQAQLGLSRGPVRMTILEALLLADRERTIELAFEFLETGTNSDLHDSCARIISSAATPEIARRVVPLLMEESRGPILAFLSATLEKLPAEESQPLALIEEMLKSDAVGVRADGFSALADTTRLDLMVQVLRDDPHPEMQGRALALLADKPETPEILNAMVEAMNSDDRKLQESALTILLGKGDERAADNVLELMGGFLGDLEIAIRAVKGSWDANPGLDERALTVLKARYFDRSGEELKRREAWIQAISQIPGPESTAFLLERANAEVGEVKGHTAHSFFVLEASNTGPGGYDLLRDAWRAEEDTRKRFSLLWAATIGHEETTRDFLIEVLQADRSFPHERLWVAERLAQEGPASLVAPIIKRTNLRMKHPVFRPAMNCLLWRWYG
jgi:hypothetical protein